MIKPDPSTIIRIIFPISSVIAIGIFFTDYLGVIYASIAAIVVCVIIWGISKIITEIDVDFERINRPDQTCPTCNGLGSNGSYMKPENCLQCGTKCTISRGKNSNSSCKKCKGSGIMKQGKISRTTCTCVPKHCRY